MNHEIGFRLMCDASIEMGAVDPEVVAFAELAEYAAYEVGTDKTVEIRFWKCASAFVLGIVLALCGWPVEEL